ncbi:MAG: ankyrin repeat domain-containing protein [Aquabacterium sp.]
MKVVVNVRSTSRRHMGWAQALMALMAAMGEGQALAQARDMTDANEWTAFRTPAVIVSGRDAPFDDLAFLDVRQEGPWARSADQRLVGSSQQMLVLLREGRWQDALKHLKEARPDLNRRDTSGDTPLTLAIKAGRIELVREMLRQGAVIDARGTDGMTPLTLAAYTGHDVIVRDLLRQGADVSLPTSLHQTALHLACAGGHTGVVAQLLKAGARWDVPNASGRHALAEAAFHGRIDVMQQLVAAGADVRGTDAHRLNAVHAAALGRQPDALHWLTERGVPVSSELTRLLIEAMDRPAFTPLP